MIKSIKMFHGPQNLRLLICKLSVCYNPSEAEGISSLLASICRSVNFRQCVGNLHTVSTGL